VKIKASDADRFAGKPAQNCCAILVYGPDSGLIRERMNTLTRSIVEDLNDPFRIIDITDSELRQDPARLSDEAAAISMLGGRRVIRLRNAGDTLTKIIGAFLEQPMGDALVLVEGDDLGPRSSLRKLFEEADNAAALPCYADDAQTLDRFIRTRLKADGIDIEADAMEYLLANLGSDRGVTQNEIEKLALYLGPAHKGEKKSVTLTDARACIDDNSGAGLDELVDAVSSGDLVALDLAFARARAADTNAIAMLNALTRHLQQLHIVTAQMETGANMDNAMRAMRPPPHFSRKADVQRQLRLWNRRRLDRALELLLETETQCKTTGMPDLAICGQAMLRIGQAARAGRKN